MTLTERHREHIPKSVIEDHEDGEQKIAHVRVLGT